MSTFIDSWEKCPRSANIASEPGIVKLRLKEKLEKESKWLKYICTSIYLLCIVEFHPRTSNLLFGFSLEMCTCSVGIELDRHEGSSGKYCINR